MTWSPVTDPSGPVSYKVSVSTVSDFSSQIAGSPFTSATTSYTAPLTLATTYYWKVNTVDKAGNESVDSLIRSFKLASPTTAAPLPNRFTNGANVVLTWGPISWAAGGFDIQVSTSSTFPAAGLISLHVNQGTQQVTVTPALADGRWYWRVRAVGSSPGAWSSAGSFTVESN
jgi:hypothetical protein